MSGSMTVRAKNLWDKWSKTNWEDFAHRTVLECHDEAYGIEVCAHHLQAYEQELQPELSRLNSELDLRRNRAASLHDGLYDRPLPVDDASMLTLERRVRTIFVLCCATASACIAGNLTTFMLLGWPPVVALLAAIFITALPLGLGHVAYEKLIDGHRWDDKSKGENWMCKATDLDTQLYR